MAILIGKDIKKAGVEVEGFVYEDFTYTSQITEHQVDAGSDPADHIKKNSPDYVVEGVISDTPMSYTESIAQLGTNISSLFTATSTTSRSVQAALGLIELWQNDEPIQIISKLGLWSNLAIASLNWRVDSETANMLRFTLRMKHIRIIHTEVVPKENKAVGVQQQSGVPITQGGIRQLQTTSENATLSAKGALL